MVEDGSLQYIKGFPLHKKYHGIWLKTYLYSKIAFNSQFYIVFINCNYVQNKLKAERIQCF